MSMVLLLGGAAAAALAFMAFSDKGDVHAKREIWLINGKRYAIAFRLESPGFDVSMFPGFCEFSEPAIIPANQGYESMKSWYEVQFTAQWCAQNTLWLVPEDVAIAEV